MKEFNFSPLLNFKYKIIGIIITIISIIGVFLYEINCFPHNIFHLDSFNFLLWLICLGLYIIVFSKEKNDNDKMIIIRYHAYKVVLIVFFSIIIALEFTNIVSNTNIEIPSLKFAIFLLLFYLLIFNIIKISKPSTSENGLYKNIKEHTKFYLLYSIIGIIIFILFLIFK